MQTSTPFGVSQRASAPRRVAQTTAVQNRTALAWSIVLGTEYDDRLSGSPVPPNVQKMLRNVHKVAKSHSSASSLLPWEEKAYCILKGAVSQRPALCYLSEGRPESEIGMRGAAAVIMRLLTLPAGGRWARCCQLSIGRQGSTGKGHLECKPIRRHDSLLSHSGSATAETNPIKAVISISRRGRWLESVTFVLEWLVVTKQTPGSSLNNCNGKEAIPWTFSAERFSSSKPRNY